jgi:hypothetical protein
VTTLARLWYAETAENGGVIIKPSSGSSVSLSLNCSEATTNWPVWQFYTGEPVAQVIIIGGD